MQKGLNWNINKRDNHIYVYKKFWACVSLQVSIAQHLDNWQQTV